MEYSYRLGNVKEGVRTTIVDKEDTPTWNPTTVEEVDVEEIRKLLVEKRKDS